MKETKILAALGQVDDAYIAEAAPVQRKRWGWIKWVATAACLALIVVGGAAAFRHGTIVDSRTCQFRCRTGSSGVKVKYTLNPRAGDLTSNCLDGLSLEEIFSTETVIFRGTVSYIDNIELDFNGRKSYRAIAGIHVDKVLQGDVTAGDVVRVLLPCPITGSVQQSATDVIAQLREGMEGIFMPKHYSEEAIWEENDATLYLRDIAPYGLWDGMRWVFLKTDTRLVFEKGVYKDIASATTLDEVEAFILTQLE